ncbi:MAG: DsrE/DsrF/DrsH-like family protein [Deltaproteobacteria bacterium]|nr:DsrE/DsrF/DrsH-like family protein [Deltaproteobacteria bacterium]
MTDSGTEKKRSLSVICSKGSFDMAYPGLILANAARMAGVDARLFFTFWGLDIVNEKKLDHLHLNLVGNPSAPIPAMICQMALDMFKLTRDDLVPQVKDVLTAMDFMDMSEGAQIIFI